MYTIILAGGLGKRMNSDIPKVLHKVNGIPMICHVIREAMKINTKEIMIVVGRYKETISRTVKSFCSKQECKQIIYIDQEDKTIDGQIKTMGTGDAIHCCVPYLKELRVDGNENVVILSGDVPLIKHSTIELLLNNKNTLLTTILSNPFGCGRIFTSNDNEIEKIVEEKDCNEEEKDCKLVNCGIYNLNIDTIIQCVPLITNNNKSNEYYLTDIVEIARTQQIPIYSILLPLTSSNEILNVNTPNDLEIANLHS
jgi:bifunctional N-acetylglucosamine-1-phosphate-uridyltransferase/glucosamine-1-phosphate-acetyltransferase GlmU-like protein